MAVDFRCEKCGKLLKMEAEPGSEVRCPHCKRKLTVPAALASLPRPQLPPNLPAPPEAPDEQDEPLEPEREDAVMAVIGALMPWVISLFFHLGLALILIYAIVFARMDPSADNDVVVAEAVRLPDPDVQMATDDEASRHLSKSDDKLQERSYSLRKTSVQPDKGKTRRRVRLIGRGGSVGNSEVFGGMTTGGGGEFFGTGAGKGRGNMHHIVFVIDRSGSMAGFVFDEVRQQMQLTIGGLSDVQDFHVILFAQDKAMENPPRRLVYATPRNKLEVVSFLQSDRVRPAGDTTVLPALKRAFKVLQAADTGGGRTGKLIFLLTDGDFAGFGGGSRYKGLSGNEAVVQWTKDNNADKQICISTFLYGASLLHPKPEATQVMKTIAAENGGRFKAISADE